MATVLLVEDDTALRGLLATALTALGLEVIEAGRLREAQARMERFRPDVLVIDGLLPDGPGLKLIESLRAAGERLPVVFMTALFRDLKTFRRLTGELGVARVLYKPIDPVDLAARVAALVPADDARGDEGPRAPATCEAEAQAAARAETDGERVGDVVRPDPGGRLEVLRVRFIRGVRLRLDGIEQALAAAASHPDRLDEARTLAHRLKGTAGTYGYPLLGEAAGRLESCLVALRRGGERGEDAWDAAEEALREARRAYAMATDEPTAPGEGGPAVLLLLDAPEAERLARAVSQTLALKLVVARSPGEAEAVAAERTLLAAVLELGGDAGRTVGLGEGLRARQPGLPLAFVVAEHDVVGRAAAARAGATRLLERPITGERLAGAVVELLEHRRAARGKVLVVEDDADLHAHYAHLLEAAGHRVETLPRADALVERLEAFAPDVLLLDIQLPHVSGLDVCRALRLSDRWELLPTLLVTARTDASTRLKGYGAGAVDVLAKPVVREELLGRVEAQLDRVRRMRQRGVACAPELPVVRPEAERASKPREDEEEGHEIHISSGAG